MKPQSSHHPNSSMYMYDLPVQPSPGSVDPSRACSGDHRLVVKEIARAQSLLTQVRAIVLPAMQADERSELVAQMFQNILDYSSKAMADLQVNHQSDDTLEDDKKKLRRIVHYPGGFSKEDVVKPHHKHKRRRFADSVSLETPVPQYDGRQWRKYGQKNINTEKHPRSYYRCAYLQEQGCKATKTVQQQDESVYGTDHPATMYTVVYYGQHTCKGSNNDCKDSTGTDDLSEVKTAMRSSSSNGGQSSISVSDLCDHQSRSIEDDKLINKCADSVEENNMLEAFDMAAFASLELDELLKFYA